MSHQVARRASRQNGRLPIVFDLVNLADTRHRHTAGHATQGVPGGRVFKMQVLVPPAGRRRRRCGATYVVFEGLRPGIYLIWYALICPPLSLLNMRREEAEVQVKGIPGNIYQGFDSRLQAEQAYVVAYALGALRALPRRDVALPQALPIPETVMTAFEASSANFLGAEWHVVFKGRRPGIYPAW